MTGCLRTASEPGTAPGPTPVAAGALTAAVSPSGGTFSLTAPDANWRIALVRIYERDDAVWILARVWREPGPAAQMLTTLRGEIPVPLPAAKLRRVFVAGKTWMWKNDEPVEFVASLGAVEKNAGAARVLFPPAGSSALSRQKP